MVRPEPDTTREAPGRGPIPAQRPPDRRHQPGAESHRPGGEEHGPDPEPPQPDPEAAPQPDLEAAPRPDPEEPSLAQPPPEVPLGLRLTSEICARLLIIALALAAVVFVVIQVSIVMIPVAIALLLTALLAPVVDTVVTRARLPRGLCTGVVLIGGIGLVVGVLSFVVSAFITGLPALIDQLVRTYQITIRPLLAGPPLRIPAARLETLPEQLQRTLATHSNEITTGALSTAATVTEVVSSMLLGLFVLIFFLHDGGRIWRFGLLVVPGRSRDRVNVAGQRAFASLVGYTRATAVVAVGDALAIGVGLWILGVPLVIPLCALVFLGAFIPIVGAVLSGAVSVAVALVANGPWTALGVLILVILVVQLESHVLQPVLLGRAVRLHPLAVVLTVAGGAVISGIVGALLAVPIVAVVTTAIRSLNAPFEPPPHEIDPLDPRHARPGPPQPDTPVGLLDLVKKLLARRS
jgi:predicted PurR-regulated permease PerM